MHPIVAMLSRSSYHSFSSSRLRVVSPRNIRSNAANCPFLAVISAVAAATTAGVSIVAALSKSSLKNDVNEGELQDTPCRSGTAQRKGVDTRHLCSCEGLSDHHIDSSSRHTKYEIERRRLFTAYKPILKDVKGQSSKCGNNLDNAVILISELLSPDECEMLMDEADRVLDSEVQYQRDLIDDDDDGDADYADDKEEARNKSLRRVSLCDMSKSAQTTSQKVIFDRVLPALRQYDPQLLRNVGLFDFDSRLAQWDWAADEPSINRYRLGGRFEPHRDGYALTVIILLSNEGSFEGGGTRFYESQHAARVYEDTGVGNNVTSTIIKPPQGTGVLFSGDIIHAGRPVSNGTRHLYVASFSLRD